MPGLVSEAESVYLLADPRITMSIDYKNGEAVISLPKKAPDPIVSVIVLEFKGEPEVVRDPEISAESDIFCDWHEVKLSSYLDDVVIRYTTDGSQPTENSPVYRKPIKLEESATVRCQVFRKGKAISAVVEKAFKKVTPQPAEKNVDLTPGLYYSYYHGKWEKLPDFNALEPLTSGIVSHFDIGTKKRPEDFAFKFRGFVKVPNDGIYKFYVSSDDGSRLYIGDELVVDNDGLHGPTEVSGRIALQAGVHPITVGFFQRSGGVDFQVFYSGRGIDKQPIPASALFHSKGK